MAQNATQTAVDDGTTVTEDDLRSLKYDDDGVERSTDQDEPEESAEGEATAEETGADDGKTDVPAEEETSEGEAEAEPADDDSEFVKEFPNIKGDTLDAYTRNLEDTIRKSNTEGKRLADENASLRAQLASRETVTPPADKPATTEVDLSNPLSLYAKQKMDEEIAAAYTDFAKGYPQVNDAGEYQQFVTTVSELSQTILNSQKRLASPRELYSKAAAVLGWKPDQVDSADKLKVALKNKAAVSKTNSSTPGTRPKSKVTDNMIKVNRLMYPDKTDDEIRKELEPYVQ